MASFFSKLFRETRAGARQSEVEVQRTPNSRKKSGRREPPTELDWSCADYIPLPPSPSTWEVDDRDEFHRDYNDPVLAPVFQAGFKHQHTKVVKLAAGLSAEQRQGRIGKIVAQAYRKLIIKRMKSGQLIAAAKQSLEMFEMVPSDVQDVDKRRFNRILGQIDKIEQKHSFKLVDVASPSSQPLFTVSYGAGWTLRGERKLIGDERPDLAFDIAALDRSGIWLLDRFGKSSDKKEVKSVLRRLDRRGECIAEKHLTHDAYRTGSRLPGGIAIMDSSGVLHIYDTTLSLVLKTNLREDTRIVDHFHTIETNYWGEFKSQVRAVDVAPESDRYLFTLADEAWCCTVSGQALWGVMMPLKEGWKRVVRRTEHFGIGSEINEALSLFGLSLPTSPIDIKRKYRSLALVYHPDRNLDSPQAEEKMKALNRAFEILTGVDPNTLDFEDSDMIHFVRTGPDQVIEVGGLQIEITMTGDTPQDWVYAANFAAANGGVYLATYSGKVIRLSREGKALVVYDIGTCPNEIIDTGRYLYLLTATRLYVIEDGTKLAAFLDVFQQGKLIVSQTGFGLLTSKKLQWFTVAGTKVGELTARDPIRALHATDGGTIVQTRQHQVEVHGLLV